MSWDPITRIVGSLGIYTKIDFENKKVVECHSTSSIFRGYSIFMKKQGSARCPFHHQPDLRHLRRQPRHLLGLRAEHGLWRSSRRRWREWIVNLGEAAEYMFDHNIFQDNLVGVDFCEKMVQGDQPGVWEKAEANASAARERSWLSHDRRHHDTR